MFHVSVGNYGLLCNTFAIFKSSLLKVGTFTWLHILFSDIANAWLETLLDVIDLLPKEVIKKDVS